jgi:exodeoxyribonuclease V beta subunit
MTIDEPVALGVPLTGVQLIEASAGTGKTWTLSGIFLRLVVETDIPIGGILAVTFTRAATAELRERIRSRLAAMLDLLEGRGSDDGLCALLAARLTDTGRARLKLRAALYGFDDAALYTIHGFCQRVLRDRAFASAMPFETEVLADASELLGAVVADFWRHHVASPPIAQDGGPEAQLHDSFVAWLLKRGITPESLRAWLGPLLDKHELRVKLPLEPPGGVAWIKRYGLLRDRGSELWRAERSDILARLATGLQRNAYRADRVRNWAAEIDAYFREDGDPLGLPPHLHRFTTPRLAAASTGAPPSHEFFTLAENLLTTHETLVRSFEARLGALRQALLEKACEALKERLREARLQTYDALLENVYDALTGPRGETLAALLRQRYPAALIDEFQDTDPLQYAIFRRIYGDGGNALVLVGDPKQAIYSFRGADLHTYLRARKRCRQVHTLDQNQRSVAGLVTALNTLFGAHAHPFRLPRIAFTPARAPDLPRAALVEEGRSDPVPLRVFLCRSKDKPLSKTEARSWAATTVATEIARLLAAAEAGGVRLGERPLWARDIAVLVNEHSQGTEVRNALQALGIACAQRSKDSVFHSPEAEQLERLLLALCEPRRIGWVRAALATDLFGLAAHELAALETDGDPLETRLADFEHYHTLWRLHGFIHMFRRLVAECGIAARLGGFSDGDRRLTNLFHLAELVHCARLYGFEAEIAWLAARRRDAGPSEDAELRIEGDEGLVQIVTIHQSKGLEYPVTFVPFLWDGKSRAAKGDTCLYHDPEDDDRPVLDLGSARRREAATLAREEDSAERLRLAYVALTRARNRCYVCFGRINEAGASPLAWLLFGTDAGPLPADPDIEDRFRTLSAEASGHIRIEDRPHPVPRRALVAPMGSPLAARQLERPVPAPERVVSFTSLRRAGGEWRAELPDHDEGEASPDPGEPGGGRSEFPRGAVAGDCLHEVLERIDFSASPDGWRGVIGRRLAESAYAPGWATALSGWIAEVLATPLWSGGVPFCLARLSPRAVLKELEFELPLGPLEPSAITAISAQHGLALPTLAHERLYGYLKGYIDLVFVHEDRFYIADYKSTWLGARPADYTQAALEAAMAASGYHLQYLLYTVALHRWLGRRIPGYDYERCFGGIYYLFLRGMQPGRIDSRGRPFGVYWARPALVLIEALDGALARVRTPMP